MFDPLIVTIISTAIFLTFFVYLPGKIISKVLGLYNWWDLHCTVGITILMLLLFLGRFILPLNATLAIYILIVVALTFWKKIKLTFTRQLPNPFIAISLIVGTVTMAWRFIVIALHGKEAILYEVYQSHDQAWHAALIAELSQHFPPQVPGFAGEILKNYHYFMDVLIAANYQLIGGDIAYYIQVTYPLLFTLFFGISIYRITSLFTKKIWVNCFTIILAYMGNNLSFFLPLIGFSDWRSDIFFLDQPTVYLGNQQTVLSLALFFYLIILLIASLKKPKRYTYAVLAAVILSALMKVKIYAFVIGAFLFGAWGIWQIWRYMKDRNISRLKTVFGGGLAAAVLSGAIYLLSFNGGKEFVVWEPGWLLQVFYERALYPIWPWFKHHYMVYKIAGNPKYYVLLLVVICLFIILNLGVRLIGLGYLMYKKPKPLGIFLLLSSVIIFVILLLTRQSAGGYNIIQFGPYAVCSLVVLTGAVFARSKLPTKVIIPLAALALLLSIPVSVKALASNRLSNYLDINRELVTVMNVLRTKPDGVTAIINVPMDIDNSGGSGGQNLIGAIGHHRAYLTDKTQVEVLDFDWEQRAEVLKNLEAHWCNLSDNDVEQIRLAKIKYFIAPSNKICEESNGVYFTTLYYSDIYTLLERQK